MGAKSYLHSAMGREKCSRELAFAETAEIILPRRRTAEISVPPAIRGMEGGMANCGLKTDDGLRGI